jgi:hypothetical protein
MSNGGAKKVSGMSGISQVAHQGRTVVASPLSDVAKASGAGGREDRASSLG